MHGNPLLGGSCVFVGDEMHISRSVGEGKGWKTLAGTGTWAAGVVVLLTQRSGFGGPKLACTLFRTCHSGYEGGV